VLDLIATGLSAIAAAREAGVHRNTIANWIKVDAFRKGLEQARFQKQVLFWDQAAAMIPEALENLRELMHNEDATPAVRLRATKTLLDHVSRYLPGDAALILPEESENTAPVHKSAQSEPNVPAPKPPTRAPAATPKPGRNELCPCGSGIKFKRCCLNKPTPPPATPSAA
jgi:uncharacterized protein YecA (UPF0149 family)